MSENRLKYHTGIVGAGQISDYHVAAIGRCPHTDLVGLVDLDPARAEAAARKFGTRTFASLREMTLAGANVIHVLTPPHSHAKVAIEALELGCHVLVEKPLATDRHDCERIDALAREKNLQVCVNHSLLYDPQVRKALAAVRAGKIGKVISVDILRSSIFPPAGPGPVPPQYATAGYPFRDLGIHALYLFEAFLGPIQKVTAEWCSLGGDPNLAYDEWRSTVKCRDGLGQFQLSWNSKPLQNQIIVQGTKGTLRVDIFSMFRSLRRSTPAPKAAERIINVFFESIQPWSQVPFNVLKFAAGRIRPYHGLQDLVAAFYDSLANQTGVPVPVSQALQVVDWTERIARMADADHARRAEQLNPPKNADILVTGASGSLGGAVVRRLRAQGHSVRVLVRRIPDRTLEDVEVVLGDLGDAATVDRAVAGVKTIIHCGAAMKGAWPDHDRATVSGTANVIAASLKHGVKKFVHISSMSVVDWAGARKGQLMDESSPAEPHAEKRGHYTRAKLVAERLVLEACRIHNLPAVILRPGQIYGEGIPLLTAAVARKVGKRWLVLGNGKVRLPLAHVENVIDAVTAAADGDLKNGEVLQIVDDLHPTQNEVLKWTLGAGAKIFRFPRPLLFILGKFSEFAFMPLRRPSPVSLYRLRSALARRSFANTRAKELLAWAPRCDFRQRYDSDSTPINGNSRYQAATTALPSATEATQP